VSTNGSPAPGAPGQHDEPGEAGHDGDDPGAADGLTEHQGGQDDDQRRLEQAEQDRGRPGRRRPVAPDQQHCPQRGGRGGQFDAEQGNRIECPQGVFRAGDGAAPQD
jgi:hypothetical protein